MPALGEVFANAGQKSNLLISVSLAGALCQLTFLFAATKYPTQSNLRDGLFWLSGGGDSLSWWQEREAAGHIAPTVNEAKR